MTVAPLCLIAAGGTGGHMFPAQALAEQLLAQGWRVTLSTDERGARYAGAFPAQVKRQVVASATTARGGVAARLLVPFRIAQGIWAARQAMKADMPAMVVGFGGYPTIPALSAAVMLGLPRMIHEQNGVLGRVNRLFAGRVSRVACGIWPTDLPQGVRGVHVGNPVRGAVHAYAGATYIPPAPDGPLHVLVIGGSQGARILSQLVPQALAGLPDDLRARLRVSHQARAEDLDEVQRTYAEAGIAVEASPFFDDVPQRMAQAQLVISRAGASSIADITAIGRPAILIPLPSATADHQSANARPLANAGAAIVLTEMSVDAKGLGGDILSILTDPSRAAAMAHDARSMGRPDAAVRLAELVTELTS